MTDDPYEDKSVWVLDQKYLDERNIWVNEESIPRIEISIQRIEGENGMTYSTVARMPDGASIRKSFTLPRKEFHDFSSEEAYSVVTEKLVQSYREVLEKVIDGEKLQHVKL